MSTLTWLHISDLHLKISEDFEEKVVLKALLQSLKEQAGLGVVPDAIFVTGDLAFSGLNEEYALVRRFFDDLLVTTCVPKNRLFVIPGNHDVDRRAIKGLVRSVKSVMSERAALNEALSNGTQRALLMEKLHNYGEFVNSYFGNELHFGTDEYYFVKCFTCEPVKIGVIGLNSAYLSTSDNDFKNIAVGERQIREAMDKAKGCDILVALVHHPFDWLIDSDERETRPLLCNNFDFILCGHSHQVDIIRASTPDSRAMVIRAGAAYESREFPNSYNLTTLSVESMKGKARLFRYSPTSGGFWAPDTLSYKNVTDGIYHFRIQRAKITKKSGTQSTSLDIPVMVNVKTEINRISQFTSLEEVTKEVSNIIDKDRQTARVVVADLRIDWLVRIFDGCSDLHTIESALSHFYCADQTIALQIIRRIDLTHIASIVKAAPELENFRTTYLYIALLDRKKAKELVTKIGMKELAEIVEKKLDLNETGMLFNNLRMFDPELSKTLLESYDKNIMRSKMLDTGFYEICLFVDNVGSSDNTRIKKILLGIGLDDLLGKIMKTTEIKLLCLSLRRLYRNAPDIADELANRVMDKMDKFMAVVTNSPEDERVVEDSIAFILPYNRILAAKISDSFSTVARGSASSWIFGGDRCRKCGYLLNGKLICPRCGNSN